MSVWLIVALVVAVLSTLTRAYFDLEWRAFMSDVQNIVAGAVVLAAALITYRGAIAKITADREDAAAARKRRRIGFRSALASELTALAKEAGRTKANATQFAGLAPDMPRREITHMRLRAPTLGVAEWQDLSTLGDDVSTRYHQLIARIGHTNLFIDAVAHGAATMKENPSVEEEVMKIAQPFRSLAENCGYIADDADRLAEEVKRLPD